jgi:hypothetical protein
MSENLYYTALWPLKTLTNYCDKISFETVEFNCKEENWIKDMLLSALQKSDF